MENARKVIARVASDSEAAALIAKSSWGSAGGVTLTDGAGYVEGRNQTVVLRLGERKVTLTPAQWVSQVRRMFGNEVGRYDGVAHDAGVCIDAGEQSCGQELQDSGP